MAEFSTPEERTEMPTGRRINELRKEGALFQSHEISQVASLFTGFMVLAMMWRSIFNHMQIIFQRCFTMFADSGPMDWQTLKFAVASQLFLVGPDILVIALCVSIVAALSVLLQTKFCIKEKKFHFRLNMLNPWNGITRIFSWMGVINTLKAILKLAIILPLAYMVLRDIAPAMISLLHLSVHQILAFSGEHIMQLFWKILYVLVGFAIFDYVWGRYQWLKQNKMTKDEVKDERKSVEGDEETKRKIVAKGLQRIAQRIRENVKKADVVVTNPTHYAVALKYDRDNMDAPIVVAKGQNHLAFRIRDIAREAGVPVLERKMLARALYASVEVGSVIPRDLFKAVAEVLAYVYRLKNPWKYAQNQQQQQ